MWRWPAMAEWLVHPVPTIAGFPVTAINNNERAGANWGEWRALERWHRQRLPLLGADQLQRQQDDRSCRRLYPAGQLWESGRADRYDDLQPVRCHCVYRTGLERHGVGHPGQCYREQSGQADGAVLGLYDRSHSHQHHRCFGLVLTHHRSRGVGHKRKRVDRRGAGQQRRGGQRVQ